MDALHNLNVLEAYEHLTPNGNNYVPCSRWGSNSDECAVTAIAAACWFSDETGEKITEDLLDEMMSYSANNSDSFAPDSRPEAQYPRVEIMRLIQRINYILAGDRLA